MMTLDCGAGGLTSSDREDEAGVRTLAWLRRVAGRLGGSVRVDDGGGAGTTVVIDLPATGAGRDDSGEQRGEP